MSGTPGELWGERISEDSSTVLRVDRARAALALLAVGGIVLAVVVVRWLIGALG